MLQAPRNTQGHIERDRRADEPAHATISRMALAMREVTALAGGCTDSDLRARQFSQSQINRLGDAAAAEAARLSTRRLKRLGGEAR